MRPEMRADVPTPPKNRESHANALRTTASIFNLSTSWVDCAVAPTRLGDHATCTAEPCRGRAVSLSGASNMVMAVSRT